MAFFGETPAESIFLNNTAWVLRNYPIFLIPGDGRSLFQPIHVRDMAQLQLDVADTDGIVETDAVGPEALRLEELFGAIHDAVGSSSMIVKNIPASFVWGLTQPLNFYAGDMILDNQELGLIVEGLAHAEDTASPTGSRKLTEWLREVAPLLGREHISPLKRYHRFVQATTD